MAPASLRGERHRHPQIVRMAHGGRLRPRAPAPVPGEAPGLTDPAVAPTWAGWTLAVAFGSAQGHRSPPGSDLLAALGAAPTSPGDARLRGLPGRFNGAIAAGVSKINIFTELGLTAGRRLCEHAASEGASYFPSERGPRHLSREAPVPRSVRGGGAADGMRQRGGIRRDEGGRMTDGQVARAVGRAANTRERARGQASRARRGRRRGAWRCAWRPRGAGPPPGAPWLAEQAIRSVSFEEHPATWRWCSTRGILLAVASRPARRSGQVLQHGTPATIDNVPRPPPAARCALPTSGRLPPGARENDGLPGWWWIATTRWSSSLHRLGAAPGAVLRPRRRSLRGRPAAGRTLGPRTSTAWPRAGLGAGGRGPVGFLENGLLFEANVLWGKDRLFFDQRENRARVRAWQRAGAP